MTNDGAIELAERAIAPCKGATLKAMQLVIAMAKAYNKTCEEALNPRRGEMKALEELDVSPAPWTAHKCGLIEVGDGNDTSMIAVMTGHKQVAANARLIAAAPELYEALRRLSIWVDESRDGKKHSLCIGELYRQAKAALAKAGGAQ